MSTARYQFTVTDERTLAPIAGMDVYVYDQASGVAATMTDDLGQPLTNPLVTDTFGQAYFNAVQSLYRADFYLDGRLRYKESNIVVGDVNVVLKGAPPIAGRANKFLAYDADGNPIASTGTGADAGLRGDLAATSGAELVGTPDGTVQEVLDTLILRSENDVLMRLCADLTLNVAANVGVFGDSTWKGYDANTGMDNPAIAPGVNLEGIARLYYGNTALTVNNRAISGTTITDLLTGGNGYPSTLAAYMAATPEDVIGLGYGLNDMAAFLVGTAGYTPETFSEQLAEAVNIIRNAGKVPVLMTPIPNFNTGTFSGANRAEMVKLYADIVRNVAKAQSVALVDVFEVFQRVLGSGLFSSLQLFPDGTHGASTTPAYQIMGYEFFKVLKAPARRFTKPDQYVQASEDAVKVEFLSDASTRIPSTAARFKLIVFNIVNSAATMRVLFEVTEPGLDIYMGHTFLDSGPLTGVPINIDGVQQVADFVTRVGGLTASDFVQSYETMILPNARPGLHILHIPIGASNGAVSFEYLRSRPTRTELSLSTGGKSERLLADALVNSASSGATPVVFDHLPSPKTFNDLEYKFTATFAKGEAFTLHGGQHGSLSGAANPFAGIMIGLDATSGYLTIWEQIGPGAFPGDFAAQTLGATDLSGVSHVYGVVSRGDLTFGVTVDGVAVGGTITTFRPYKGGVLGLFKNASGGTARITNLVEIR